ncbi:hypothetical protein GRJ2_003333700 [Grus japonensis]|uniref:Uncharacterized protein n=1 Tax=Grus japonensis TaxID=30415 RepID=A0ABC9YHB2_GRUJA
MKARYPLKEDLRNYQGKYSITEEDVQYLRELAVMEMIYSNLDNNQASEDPDDVQCMWSMWQKVYGMYQCHMPAT